MLFQEKMQIFGHFLNCEKKTNAVKINFCLHLKSHFSGNSDKICSYFTNGHAFESFTHSLIFLNQSLPFI